MPVTPDVYVLVYVHQLLYESNDLVDVRAGKRLGRDAEKGKAVVVVC